MEQQTISFINLEYIFSRIFEALVWIRNFFLGASTLDMSTTGGFTISTIISFAKGLITILVLLLIAGIIYAWIRKKEIDSQEEKRYEGYFVTHVAETPRNERWEKVEKLFASMNPSDWRLGIIEADAMLDDLLIQLGYPGESLGERLKNVNKNDFPTLQLAWDAHLVRNRIAHEGLQFHLTEREARQAKVNYETVFRDAQYI